MAMKQAAVQLLRRSCSLPLGQQAGHFININFPGGGQLLQAVTAASSAQEQLLLLLSLPHAGLLLAAYRWQVLTEGEAGLSCG